MLTIDREGEAVHAVLFGNLYVEEASIIRQKLQAVIEDGCRYIDIDVSRVDYIDSSGLGVLIAVHKRLAALEGEMRLVGPRGMVLELLELTRLTKVFTIDGVPASGGQEPARF